jgi:hypothetical protein
MEPQPQPSTVESFDFRCTAEWHLARLGAKYAAPVYSFALYLTKTTGRFYPSLSTLAEYFDANPRYIGKAIKQLVKARFFIELKRDQGFPVSYRPVLHTEWKKKHPGCCLEKVAMPWSAEEVDPLVKRLHSASDGRLKLYPNFVRGMRATKLSDDEIVAAFADYYSAEGRQRKLVGMYARFMEHLRDVYANKQGKHL